LASPGLVHNIYIFWGSCSIMEFCQVQKSTLRPSFNCVLYWQRYCTTLEHWESAKLCGIVSSGESAAIPFDIGRSNCLLLEYFVVNFQLLLSIIFDRCLWHTQPGLCLWIRLPRRPLLLYTIAESWLRCCCSIAFILHCRPRQAVVTYKLQLATENLKPVFLSFRTCNNYGRPIE